MKKLFFIFFVLWTAPGICQVNEKSLVNPSPLDEKSSDEFSFYDHQSDALLTSCNYTIRLWDSYGDGWTNCKLDVIVGGVTVLNDIDLPSGYGPLDIPFPVSSNAEITTTFTIGNYPCDPYYQIFDNLENLVIYVPNNCNPVIPSGTLYAQCQAVPFPDVDLGPDRIACEGESVTLDAGYFPGAEYHWWPGNQTTQTIEITTTGLYSVEVENAGGIDNDDIQVTFYICGSPSGNCDYTIKLYDSFGDGWNGSTLDVFVGASCVLDDIFLQSGYGPATHTFPVTSGQGITTTFNPGNWVCEPYYYIYNAENQQVAYVSGCYPELSPPGILACCPILENYFSGCEGDVIALDAGYYAGAAYLWSTGEVTQSINVTTTGNYNVIITIGALQYYGETYVYFDPLPDPAGPISGPNQVCKNTTGVVYCVDPIANATTYNWVVPAGVQVVSGSGTNCITVDIAPNAHSGVIRAWGENDCGDGARSAMFLLVLSTPKQPTIVKIGGKLKSSGGALSEWFYAPGPTGGPITSTGYTGTIYIPQVSGSYYYFVIVTGPNGCQSLESNRIMMPVAKSGEINAMENEGLEPLEFSLFPNPSQGQFTLELKGNNGRPYKMTVLNMLGIKVYESVEYFTVNETAQHRIDLQQLSGGLYWVILTDSENHRAVRKILITE